MQKIRIKIRVFRRGQITSFLQLNLICSPIKFTHDKPLYRISMKANIFIICTLVLFAACTPKQSAPVPSAGPASNASSQGIVTVMDYGKDMLNNLKPGEALNPEYSEKMYAYVFSAAMENPAEIAEFTEGIKNTSALYVTQTSAGKYYVISYEGKPEQELIKNLPAFKASLPTTLSQEEIKVISLSGFCAGSEHLLKKQFTIPCRQQVQLACFTCTR